MTQDAIPALTLSAHGGQGDPSSKLFYIHQVEARLASYSRHAHPTAWHITDPQARAPGLFPDLCDGQLSERPPIPEGPFGADALRQSEQLTLVERAALLWDVQRKLRLDAVAGNARVDLATARLVIAETITALIEVRLAGEEADVSLLSRCLALVEWKAAAAVSKEVKHAALLAYLDSLLARSQWGTLNRLWRDWRSCLQREWVSVLDGRPAARLIQCLLDAGVPRGSLAIVSATRGAPLPGPVASLDLQPGRPVKPYRGRAAHRLVMTAHGLCAADARGGAVTMTGLHWCFVVLVSALAARGKL
jgi:hypothetical protein